MRFLDRLRDIELYMTSAEEPKRRGMHWTDFDGVVYRITRVVPCPGYHPRFSRVFGVPVGHTEPQQGRAS